MSELIAQGNTVIIEPVYRGLESSLIVIPEEIKKRHGMHRGRVISVGPDYKYGNSIKVGDLVVYRADEGIEIEDKGRIYKSLKGKWVDAVEE